MLGKRARASSAMTPVSPLSMGRLKSRSRTFRLRRWALSVWNNSVQHNTQASDTLQVGPLRVEQLCATQHAGFRHTSGGPSPCGTALCNTTHRLQAHFRWALCVWNSSVQHNTTHRLQTHFRWALCVWNSSVKHNTQASDTLQVGPLHVEQLCTTQHKGVRHTSGGPSVCGTALYNTTHRLQTQSTHFRWSLTV